MWDVFSFWCDVHYGHNIDRNVMIVRSLFYTEEVFEVPCRPLILDIELSLTRQMASHHWTRSSPDPEETDQDILVAEEKTSSLVPPHLRHQWGRIKKATHRTTRLVPLTLNWKWLFKRTAEGNKEGTWTETIHGYFYHFNWNVLGNMLIRALSMLYKMAIENVFFFYLHKVHYNLWSQTIQWLQFLCVYPSFLTSPYEPRSWSNNVFEDPADSKRVRLHLGEPARRGSLSLRH